MVKSRAAFDPTKKDEASEFYAVYEDYGRTLRTWLVAYGVGGPVLFLTKEEVSTRLIASGQGAGIAWLFILGAALQVIIALVNKWSSWLIYAGRTDTAFRSPGKPIYSVASWISGQYWLDVLCDVGAVILFGIATVRTLLIMTAR